MIKKIFFIIFCVILFSLSVPAAQGISGDIFGKYVGILHPSLSIDGKYSSNIYKTSDNTESDLIITMSPSVWLAFPGIREKLSEIDTSNTAPGGLSLELTKGDTFRRYQTFFYYSPEIKKYLSLSKESIEDHRLGGIFQFNLRGGLSINLIEQFQNSHEGLGIGLTRYQDRYKSNLFHMILFYDVTEKISLRGDFSNYRISYAGTRVTYGNRSDNLFSTYVYYKVMPKTSVFGEIEHLRVGYENAGFYDSNEMRFFAGVKWDVTEKSVGSFKTGYGTKSFTEDIADNSGDFILELATDFVFTPKTKVTITGLRRSTETTVLETEYSLVNSFLVDYVQTITDKIDINFGLLFTSENYKGDRLYGDEFVERSDNKYRFLAAVDYRIKDWLSTKAEFSNTKRSSNVSYYEYSDNSFVISLTGAL